MDWLGSNSFFLIILLLCIGMHLFHGHGSHDNTPRNKDNEDKEQPNDRH